MSRKTVKRFISEYIDQKDSENPDLGVITPPKYDSSSRTKKKLTEDVISFIDECLERNDEKKSRGLAKQCMAGTDIHQALVGKGYHIGYTTVCCYIRQYRQKGQEVYIRQDYEPGSCAEFDWGEVKLKMNGKVKRLMLAVFTLAYSNYRWAMLFYRQDMSSFLQAHVSFFNHIEGVPFQLVYDNMKTAVAKCTIRQKDKKPTEDLLKISAYYQFDFRFCNVAKGNEKGHVEKSVEYVRRKAFCQIDEFDNMDQANRYLNQQLSLLNSKKAKRKTIPIVKDFLTEKKHFICLPVSDYDISIIQEYKIDKYHTISVDANQYSVPDSICTPRVKVKVFPNHIFILDSNNNLAARHNRLHAKYQWVIDINHYWNSFYKKPGALPYSTALAQAPDILKNLFDTHYQSIPKVFIKLVLYCKDNQLSMDQLRQATSLSIQKCLNTPITFDKVSLILQNMKTIHHSSDPKITSTDSMAQSITNNCMELLAQVQAQFS
jgi:transposase